MQTSTYLVQTSQGSYLITVKPVGLDHFLVSARKPNPLSHLDVVPAVLTDNVQRTVNEIVPD
jgi:hypothetical protein